MMQEHIQGLELVLTSFWDVASIILLSKVLDLLAKPNCSMQRQAADFSRLLLIFNSIEKKMHCFIERS